MLYSYACNIYFNLIYNVIFLYPFDWQRVADLRYEGANGFFQIGAISSDETLEMVCQAEASNPLNPYGTLPTILPVKLHRQEACLILPSPDQPNDMNNQTALIVEYPKPMVIKGHTYNYFILWASKAHIRQIASTLRFIIRD